MSGNVDTSRDYNYILERVGPKKFRERLDEMIDSAERYIQEAGYGEHVVCNERIMLNVLLDYFADIFRLKDFHGIENTRTEKIFAYTAAWIVKRKPLQFIYDTDEEKDIFVNERFAVFLILNECLLCGERKFVSVENRVKLDEYIDLLLYYLKYRECNPQVLELMIESFKMGTLVEA